MFRPVSRLREWKLRMEKAEVEDPTTSPERLLRHVNWKDLERRLPIIAKIPDHPNANAEVLEWITLVGITNNKPELLLPVVINRKTPSKAIERIFNYIKPSYFDKKYLEDGIRDYDVFGFRNTGAAYAELIMENIAAHPNLPEVLADNSVIVEYAKRYTANKPYVFYLS